MMILDHIDHAELYCHAHPGFRTAFEWLRKTDLSALPAGRTEIDGERLFVVMNIAQGKGRTGARLESHRKYIDIQYTFRGSDEIGWKLAGDCRDVFLPFDESKDVALYNDTPCVWLPVPEKRFAVFFPNDAHAPMGATGEILKAVMKVAVDY